jgi:hypothetical protein
MKESDTFAEFHGERDSVKSYGREPKSYFDRVFQL